MTRRRAPLDAAHARRLTQVGVVLLGVNVALLALAFFRGESIIRDGAASVTSGNLVAWGIVLTLLAVVALHFARLPLDVERHAQVFALAAQTLHAGGHLFRFYFTFPAYDTLLHGLLTAWLALLAFSAARAWRVIPPRLVTPLRAALIVTFAGVALAGAWEIFEYTADSVLGTREQDNLDDTMEDMIAGGLGTVAAAWWAHRRASREPRPHAHDGRKEPT